MSDELKKSWINEDLIIHCPKCGMQFEKGKPYSFYCSKNRCPMFYKTSLGKEIM